VSSWLSVLSTISASLAPVPCDVNLAAEAERESPVLLHDQPKLNQPIGFSTAQLKPGAILAEEVWLVPIRRFVSLGPIIVRGQRLTDDVHALRAFRWQGKNWACANRWSKSDPVAVPNGPGVCVRDSDGDGKVDKALLDGSETDVEPIGLGKTSLLNEVAFATVRLRLVADKLSPNSFSVSAHSETVLSNVSTYIFSVAGQNAAAKPFNATLRLVPGKMHRLGPIRLYMVRHGGQWSIRTRGGFDNSVRVCNQDTTVWLGGAQAVAH